jgi:outer membrane protein assembly factor BamB
MSPQRRFWFAAVLVLAGSPTASADDWPRWRGPARSGISAERGWLDAWPADGPKVLWKAEVGVGFSSFAVAGGRAYTIGNANDADTVFCLDAETGKVLWYHPYPSELGDKFFEGGPTSTPTVDGDRVYTIGRAGDLFCFDAASGKIAWSKNIAKEFGFPLPQWGFGGSPVILGSQLLLNAGEAGLALDKSDGHLLWKSAAAESGYSTPLPIPGDGGLVLFSSGKAYIAVDPKTGKEAWRIKWVTTYGVNAADPLLRDGTMLVSTGYGKGAALFRLGAGGAEVLWQNRVLKTQINPAVLIDGVVYGIDGDAASEPGAKKKALLKGVDLGTGTEKWTFPLADVGSIAAADGKLLVFSGDGELLVGPASPDGFKPTARAKVLGGRCWTVPVLANGRILCRNAEGQVVCIDVRKP